MSDEETIREAEMPGMVDEKTVLEWLHANPGFWQQHPELLLQLAPPKQEHGGNVEDFQFHMLARLQDHLKGLKEHYEGLIISTRDNMSTQAQVHEAVLGIVKAPDLEALLQMLRQDMVRLFDVDVVRLAMESPVAEYYNPHYAEHDYSGISFVDPGLVDAAIGHARPHRLVPRVAEEMNDGLRQIFADCAGLIQSCAVLRLDLPSTQRQAALAFAVRYPERFQPQQGVELLTFLARIVGHRLDQCLQREGLDEL